MLKLPNNVARIQHVFHCLGNRAFRCNGQKFCIWLYTQAQQFSGLLRSCHSSFALSKDEIEKCKAIHLTAIETRRAYSVTHGNGATTISGF